MNFRSDLALECREPLHKLPEGLLCNEERFGDVKVTRVEVCNEAGSAALGKPIGKYITIEFPSLEQTGLADDPVLELYAKELLSLLPNSGLVLCVGLGNDGITPDALGPRVCARILATRHISGEQAKTVGVSKLRPVACLVPGVLGRTGIESAELLNCTVRSLKPAAVVVVDALASRRLSRLGRTIQISTSGIVPGSGVGNARAEISQVLLGTPVLSIGVPTVVDAKTLTDDLIAEAGFSKQKTGRVPNQDAEQMMVTPREVDLLVERGARLLALGINCALQPELEPEDFAAMMDN